MQNLLPPMQLRCLLRVFLHSFAGLARNILKSVSTLPEFHFCIAATYLFDSSVYPVEEEGETTLDAEGNNITIPIDITLENPNGTEFDNLYLDMNGIVCSVAYVL
jgi:hypothetical protein